MKLPVNYAEIRMEQLLRRIRTNFEMVKDAESKHMIIALLRSVSDAIQNSIKEKTSIDPTASKSLRRRIEVQSGGYLTPEDSKYPPDMDYAD